MPITLNGDGSIAGGTFNRPAFRAELVTTDQIIADNVNTIIQFNNNSTGENFDTNNCYSTSTFKFIPDVAGYYLINAHATFSTTSTPNLEDGELRIRKNDTSTLAKAEIDPSNSQEMDAVTCNATAIIQMNGTSDFIQVLATIKIQSSNANIKADNHQTYFQAFKLAI
tara:strand:- start:1100 stop:1603 length:504 start_codon:yes stop_codon:yes gene_type:complete